MSEWRYLDPDYRIDPPTDTALYCCRCQRTRGNLAPVELHENGLYVRKCGPLGANGNAYLGTDCYSKVFPEDTIKEKRKRKNGETR